MPAAGFTPQERASFAERLCPGGGFVDCFRAQYPEAVGYTYWSYRCHQRAGGVGVLGGGLLQGAVPGGGGLHLLLLKCGRWVQGGCWLGWGRGGFAIAVVPWARPCAPPPPTHTTTFRPRVPVLRFNARATNRGWRLDHFLVSKALHPRVHECYLLPTVLGSDHSPLGLVVKL